MSKKRLYPLDESSKSRWGFKDKTFLDVIQIFGIPIAALIMTGGLAFYDDSREDRRLLERREVADQTEQYKILRGFIDSVSKLMNDGLGIESEFCQEGEEICIAKHRVSIAQARTEAAMDQLTDKNKIRLMKFLSGAGLLKGNGIISLAGVNLENTNLKSFDLSLHDLRDANFRRADLIGADLQGADLSGADFRGARLRGVNLSRATFRGTKLEGASMNQAILRYADLRWSGLNQLDLSQSIFELSDLRDANLSGANLRDTYLTGADLSGANFREANLSEANLNEANLSGANLSGAKISLSQILSAKTYEGVILDEDLQKELDDWIKNNPKVETENE